VSNVMTEARRANRSPESAAILDEYAAQCGIVDLDIASVHLAIMVWRDLSYYVSFHNRAQRDVRREVIHLRRVKQLLDRA